MKNPHNRRGAILSAELMLVTPVLIGLLFAIVEFSLLWSATHQIQLASQVACREGAAPVRDHKQLQAAVDQAARRAITNPRIRRAYELRFEDAKYTGDPVTVEIVVPMRAVSPNLLAAIGFDIRSRQLQARTVMRKE